ncbi:MAG: sugar phosphate isomerase/epimerase [Chloroflexi bacterium]|nr:sugar phosphate isomerase/epimerase [Chloroflexota bacterium]
MRLGLLVRLFTATHGRIDVESSAAAAKPRWERSTVTRAEFEASLDLAAEIGAEVVEITQAGQPAAAELLVASPRLRREFSAMVADRGLSIAALNAAGMPLHPRSGGRARRLIRRTIELASLLDVRTVISMSGTGGDGPAASTVNWVSFPWPEESVALRERHWQAAVGLWRDLAGYATSRGIERVALELHPMHLVYNVPTFHRLHAAVGSVISANVDPSHLFWQGMDPSAVVRALGDSVAHVHVKDTQLVADELATAGVLDGRPFGADAPRAWVHRTVGHGHGDDVWTAFFRALRDGGYSGALSLENEDPYQSYTEGVREAATYVRPILRGLK